MNNMILPRNVKYVLERIESGGYEAYVVGGCVRDHLMGKQPKDYDITTSARPEAIKKLFAKTFDTGIKHGTVTVVADKTNIEVTSFRIDGEYLDNRRPEHVEFTTDLSLDLLRRDFTMNAIAYGTYTGYIDLYGGITDIVNKTIRGVGEPARRYGEDALRMLRAIRFAGQLGFDIEATTYEAITDNSALIKNISAERIRDEFCKLLLSGFPEKTQLITATGLMEYISKPLDNYCAIYLKDIIPQLKLCDNKISFRLALLLKNMEQDQIKKLLTFLRFETRLIKEVMLLTEWLNTDIAESQPMIRRVLSITGPEAFESIIYLKSIVSESIGEDLQQYHRLLSEYKRIMLSNDCITMAQLKINGDDLIKLGFSGGKTLGKALSSLFDMVLIDPKKNHEEILQNEALKLYGLK